MKRHIRLSIGSRFAIGIGINAEDTKVACMTGPHPVVGVRTELTNRRGRCPYQPDVRIDLLRKHIILIAAIEGLDLDLYTRMLLQELFAHLLLGQTIQVLR